MGGYDPIYGMMHRWNSLPEKTMEDAAKADAEAAALRFLAETHCPEDVVRYGEAHRLPAFAQMTWLNGFQAGWRAYHSRLPKPPTTPSPRVPHQPDGGDIAQEGRSDEGRWCQECGEFHSEDVTCRSPEAIVEDQRRATPASGREDGDRQLTEELEKLLYPHVGSRNNTVVCAAEVERFFARRTAAPEPAALAEAKGVTPEEVAEFDRVLGNTYGVERPSWSTCDFVSVPLDDWRVVTNAAARLSAAARAASQTDGAGERQWQVKDYAGEWSNCRNEAEARKISERTGAAVRARP